MACFRKDQLDVEIYKTDKEMGKIVADDVAKKIRELLKCKEQINIVFASAPSQDHFLNHLIEKKDLDWSRIVAFHLDEYVGLNASSQQKFGTYLYNSIFSKLNFKKVYYIEKTDLDAGGILNRYSSLLRENPIDIACIGIGENGHIAFNDPHVADFTDTKNFKLVTLDEKCRMQQVNDSCFKSIEEVPTKAYTMTVPAIYSADYIYCIVPSKNKSKAVKETLEGEISTMCPASILRIHPRAKLYLDREAAQLLTSI